MLHPRSFRLDRAISVWLSAKQRSQCQRVAGRIPILMYHGINEQIGSKHPYYETNTSPKRFREQLRWMVSSGYQTCNLGTALATVRTGEMDHRKLVITFDDGYADLYDKAFSVLVEYGFSATVFVVTNWISTQRYSRNGREYLTWNELRELQTYGIEVGSHTASHCDLQTLTSMEVEEEVRRSKEIIEDNLGKTVQSFAYPFAFPEASVSSIEVLKSALKRHNYKNGVCTIIGMAQENSDQYYLPRLPVNTYDDEKLLQAKLEGGYDWMHRVQYAKKALQSNLSGLFRG